MSVLSMRRSSQLLFCAVPLPCPVCVWRQRYHITMVASRVLPHASQARVTRHRRVSVVTNTFVSVALRSDISRSKNDLEENRWTASFTLCVTNVLCDQIVVFSEIP